MLSKLSIPTSDTASAEAYNTFLDRLFDALAQSKDLDQLLELGYEFLGNPMKITDMNFKMVAHTKTRAENDSYWSEMQADRYLPNSHVSEVATEGIAVMSSDDLFLANFPSNTYTWLVSRIMAHGRVWGTLSITCSNKEASSMNLQIVSALRKGLTLEIERHHRYTDSRGMSESFFRDILEEKLSDSTLINSRAQALNWNLSDFFYIVAIKNENSYSIRPLTQLLSDDTDGFALEKPIFLRNRVVLIRSTSAERPMDDSRFEKLQAIIEQRNLQIGVSECFRDLSRASTYYKQALKAIEFGERLGKGQKLYLYSDYWLHHLLQKAQSKTTLSNFLYRPFLKLIEMDEAHSAEYIKTLHAYIANNASIVDSARALNIHRNTMVYRLDRIKEIVGEDISDIRVLFRYQTSFCIYDMTEAL